MSVETVITAHTKCGNPVYKSFVPCSTSVSRFVSIPPQLITEIYLKKESASPLKTLTIFTVMNAQPLPKDQNTSLIPTRSFFFSKNQKVTPTCDKKTKKITTENQEALS